MYLFMYVIHLFPFTKPHLTVTFFLLVLKMMGLHGLEIVRFHGRYYVYEDPIDGYPVVVDEKIVSKVPVDVADYQSKSSIFLFFSFFLFCLFH